MMDYLFMIELNAQTADLSELQKTIGGFNQDILYLEIDELDKGLVGIVRFAEAKLGTDPNIFFDQIRGLVADINGLPIAKVQSRTLNSSDAPSAPAIWARASLGDILVGFGVEGKPNLNSDINAYQILSTLKGGIGGKH